MFKANLVTPAGNTLGPVFAAGFDPAVLEQGVQLKCPCGAVMHFRQAARVSGSARRRAPHFAADSRIGHKATCLEKSSDEDAGKTIGITRALENGIPIIIHLNLGDMAGRRTRGVSLKQARKTAIAATGNKNYKAVSVTSAMEYSSITARIRSIQEAWQKTNLDPHPSTIWVSYKGVVRPIDELFVNRKMERIQAFLDGVMRRTSDPRRAEKGPVKLSPYLPMAFILRFSEGVVGEHHQLTVTSLFNDKAKKEGDLFSKTWVSDDIFLQHDGLPFHVYSDRASSSSALPKRFPWDRIRFVFRTDDDEINQDLQSTQEKRGASRIIAAVNETALRRAIYSHKRADQKGNILEIPLIVNGAHQMSYPDDTIAVKAELARQRGLARERRRYR